MPTHTTVPALEVDLSPGRPPLLHAAPQADATRWAAQHRAALRTVVAEHGSVLVRGLGLSDPAEATAVLERLGSGLMTEREGFARRRRYADGVYSSATWAADQPMCMHHELSYANEAPGLLLFACLQPPTVGGATGAADASAVLDALPEDLVTQFEREGWLLTRRYGEEIGASGADAFGTDDPRAIEAYCRANAIDLDWLPGGGLRTRQRRRAVVRHPISGRRCWFNQIAFLNVWTLDPDVRAFLLEEYGAEGLPFNTSFGGGEGIGEDVVRLINDTYDALTTREPWQAGDLMLVDNVRSAHSREAYQGSREVLVAMSDPVLLSVAATSEGTR